MVGEQDRTGSLGGRDEVLSLSKYRMISEISVAHKEIDTIGRSDRTYVFILAFPFTTQILLCIDNQSLSTSQILLEHGIARSQWYSIVAAFDHEVYMGEHGLHLVQTCTMMPEEI